MITRISISKIGKSGGHYWLLYRWERDPLAGGQAERLTFTVLAEGVTGTRDQATDEALKAADHLAPGEPLEDWLSAARPILGHDPEKRDRRWAAAFMSEGATALARKAEVMAHEGRAPREYVQEETGRLYSERGEDEWVRWSIIGSTGKRVHAVEIEPGGKLRPNSVIAALEPNALMVKGSASFQGLRLYTKAGKTAHYQDLKHQGIRRKIADRAASRATAAANENEAPGQHMVCDLSEPEAGAVSQSIATRSHSVTREDQGAEHRQEGP